MSSPAPHTNPNPNLKKKQSRLRMPKPMTRIHVHDAPLKCIPSSSQDSWVEFQAYFKDLATSDEFTAGWEMMTLANWGGNAATTQAWLEETAAVGEWRSSSGEGNLNQFRCSFDVDHDLEDLYNHMVEFRDVPLTRTSLEHKHEADNKVTEKGDVFLTKDVYLASRLKWPLSPRDFKYERLDSMSQNHAFVLSRNRADTPSGLLASKKKRYVRATVDLGGYWMERVTTAYATTTRVTYVLQGNLNGVVGKFDWLRRKAAGPQLRAVVDATRSMGGAGEEEKRAGARKRMSTFSRLLRAASGGSFAEQESDSGGEDERQEEESRQDKMKKAWGSKNRLDANVV